MIDIHPPEHTPHTWRDFFIHMGTIVLGLCIAIGLEQTAVYFHHRNERRQLREDLLAEAQQRVEQMKANVQINADDVAWYRQILRAGREAPVSGGYVTFAVPTRAKKTYISIATSGVWPAATASGEAALLSRNEIELWNDVDSYSALTAKSFDSREEALRAGFAMGERTGVKIYPGATVRLSAADRDEAMRETSILLEDTWMLERNDALWQGACEAMLHGAKTPADLNESEGRAVTAMPQ